MVQYSAGLYVTPGFNLFLPGNVHKIVSKRKYETQLGQKHKQELCHGVLVG